MVRNAPMKETSAPRPDALAGGWLAAVMEMPLIVLGPPIGEVGKKPLDVGQAKLNCLCNVRFAAWRSKDCRLRRHWLRFPSPRWLLRPWRRRARMDRLSSAFVPAANR